MRQRAIELNPAETHDYPNSDPTCVGSVLNCK